MITPEYREKAVDKLLWRTDPGHGWLAVPAHMIRDTGIGEQISSFSYVNKSRRTVFLEEDCDAGILLRALGLSEDQRRRIRTAHGDYPSSIRRMTRWSHLDRVAS